ncbi:DUF4194 domain-containing protein [Salinibius halmophilus]|uniref:DUF4194 domain-containing protein n=1 Tax=Salinibius halmophilus TaxID=1853216 RepID=UPI000E661F53|nr:DUF4194 domain-containing protein [Salinibius halmophilus]
MSDKQSAFDFFEPEPVQPETVPEAELSETEQLASELVDTPQANETTEASDTNEENEFEPSSEEGLLPLPTRKAIAYLLRNGVLLASQKPKLFADIVAGKRDIRSYLNQIFIDLTLDEHNGVAFIGNQQIDDEDAESFSLISQRQLLLIDTLLLLVLRKYYQERETQGEQTIAIDDDKMADLLSPFMPLFNRDKDFDRIFNPAVKRLLEKKLLLTIRGSEERYEVSPLIRYVVSAEFLQQLLSEYTRMAGGEHE